MSTQSRRRRLEVEDIGDVTVVNFIDKKILDEQNIQIIGEQLFNLVDELDRASCCSISTMSNICPAPLWASSSPRTRRSTRWAAGSSCATSLPQIHEVFEITKLDKLFNIQKEEQAALQAF